MTYARTRLLCGTVTMCAVLLAGCTAGRSGPGGESRQASAPGDGRNTGGGETGAAGASGDAGALPGASPTEQADPAKQPRTVREARAFVRKVIADPELIGAGAVRAAPYESDPRRWSVLGEDCVWRRQALPDDVLATLTRHFEVPSNSGKAPVRLSATVTVHRTALDAAWEQAGMLEEAAGCPEQTLGAGERLTDLVSTALGWWGEGGNTDDDTLTESGRCVSDTRGGPSPYAWTQVTFGSVVVAASVCGRPESTTSDANVVSTMLARVQKAIASPTGSGAASRESAPSSPSPGARAAKGGE